MQRLFLQVTPQETFWTDPGKEASQEAPVAGWIQSDLLRASRRDVVSTPVGNTGPSRHISRLCTARAVKGIWPNQGSSLRRIEALEDATLCKESKNAWGCLEQRAAPVALAVNLWQQRNAGGVGRKELLLEILAD